MFTDLLQQMPQGWYKGWRSLVARLYLMTGPRPQVPRKFRLAFTGRAQARADGDHGAWKTCSARWSGLYRACVRVALGGVAVTIGLMDLIILFNIKALTICPHAIPLI